jgi:HEXXH motif-containing protein
MINPFVDEEIARYFSSPSLNSDSQLPQSLIGEYARALLVIAFEHCYPFLVEFNPDMPERISRLIEGTIIPWSAAWTPAIARIEAHLANSSTPANLWSVLAPFIVQVAAAGLLTDFDIRLVSPQIMYWGSIKLPLADRIVFRRVGDCAELELFRSNDFRASLLVDRSSAEGWKSEDLQSLPIVWLGPKTVPLYYDDDMPFPTPSGRSVLKNALERTESVFAEASELLSTYSPHFLPWVAEGIRNVVPLDASDGIRMSATVEEFPALTFLSFPAPGVEIAETLVHEASHHFYFALQRLTPLHDGSDTNEYYSPIKKRGRTIDLILFAFHAFGNAALFHRDLVRGGDNRYQSLNGRTLEVSLERLRALDIHLRETRALTTAGESLWKPIAEQLFDPPF